ncbi:hypothetical protein P280DRAFT_42045 [Massarina eburnea CBS 473.64]|uniref:Uncharacterized protein n=1 Tax=Massarina eburnea CBS 473.64 TaxID=1395130 RepID=A0A6A6RYT8_9PLEO|nr:hypothetical protein P280DRAFT_42045 [Massarina eburnea CBS 473.64]
MKCYCRLSDATQASLMASMDLYICADAAYCMYSPVRDDRSILLPSAIKMEDLELRPLAPELHTSRLRTIHGALARAEGLHVDSLLDNATHLVHCLQVNHKRPLALGKDIIRPPRQFDSKAGNLYISGYVKEVLIPLLHNLIPHSFPRTSRPKLLSVTTGQPNLQLS